LAIVVLPRALRQPFSAHMVLNSLWELVYVWRPRPHMYAPQVKAVVAERREKSAKTFMMLVVVVAVSGSLEVSLSFMSVSPGDWVRHDANHFSYFAVVMPFAMISLSMMPSSCSSSLDTAHITQILACLCLSAQSFFVTTQEARRFQTMCVIVANVAFSCSGVDPRLVTFMIVCCTHGLCPGVAGHHV